MRIQDGACVRSIVPIDLLASLVALLRLDRQRRDGARVEAAQRDGLARLLAIAVDALVDPGERRLDLGDQLALPVAGAQLDGAVGLGRGAIGEIGMIFVIALQNQERFTALLKNLIFPYKELAFEIFALPFVHERLLLR